MLAADKRALKDSHEQQRLAHEQQRLANILRQSEALTHNPDVQYALSLLSNGSEMFSWLEKAAAQNHAEALYSLARCYMGSRERHDRSNIKSRDIAHDYFKASQLLEKATHLKNTDAQSALGFFYCMGYGLIQDYLEAKKLLETAVNKGDVYAAINLGLLYYYGDGVKQDDSQARLWWEKAKALVEYDLVLMPYFMPAQKDKNKIYIKVVNNTVQYITHKTRNIQTISAADLGKEDGFIIPGTLQELTALKHNILKVTANRGHTLSYRNHHNIIICDRLEKLNIKNRMGLKKEYVCFEESYSLDLTVLGQYVVELTTKQSESLFSKASGFFNRNNDSAVSNTTTVTTRAEPSSSNNNVNTNNLTTSQATFMPKKTTDAVSVKQQVLSSDVSQGVNRTNESQKWNAPAYQPYINAQSIVNNRVNNSTTVPTLQTKTTLEIDNPLLTDPTLIQYLTFLKALPPSCLDLLKTLSQQCNDINNMLLTLSQLKTSYEDLIQRLTIVELQAGLDKQTLTEIDYIQKNKQLNCYYQTLKMILGQTFLAAKVICSNEVDASKGSGATIVGGMSKVVSAAYPPLAPFLGLATLIIDKIDEVDSFRAMKKLASWASLEEMALFASMLARQLTLAKEYHFALGLTDKEKKILQIFKDKCSLLVTYIKSGESLNMEESRALMDANELLIYMKKYARSTSSSLANCVVILLPVIMGEGYVSSVTTINNTPENTAVVATARPYTITQQEWEASQKEIADAKKKAAEAERKAEEAQRQLALLNLKTNKSNSNSSYGIHNGTQMSMQLQELTINTRQGAMPLSDAFKQFEEHKDRMEDFAKEAGSTLHLYQELQRNNGQQKDSKYNEKNRQALLGNDSDDVFEKTLIL